MIAPTITKTELCYNITPLYEYEVLKSIKVNSRIVISAPSKNSDCLL